MLGSWLTLLARGSKRCARSASCPRTILRAYSASRIGRRFRPSRLANAASPPRSFLSPSRSSGLHSTYFTNPFLLVGEGKFSWRQSNVALERLNAFERVAGRWVAANRALAPEVGRPAPNLRQALKLTSKSSFEEAMAAGERFAADFELGAVPAERLAEVMERRLGRPCPHGRRDRWNFRRRLPAA